MNTTADFRLLDIRRGPTTEPGYRRRGADADESHVGNRDSSDERLGPFDLESAGRIARANGSPPGSRASSGEATQHRRGRRLRCPRAGRRSARTPHGKNANKQGGAQRKSATTPGDGMQNTRRRESKTECVATTSRCDVAASAATPGRRATRDAAVTATASSRASTSRTLALRDVGDAGRVGKTVCADKIVIFRLRDKAVVRRNIALARCELREEKTALLTSPPSSPSRLPG